MTRPVLTQQQNTQTDEFSDQGVRGVNQREKQPATATAVAHPQSGTDTLLELRHVHKEYPVTAGRRGGASKATVALDDVSLTVKRGQVIALIGPSGCGKSTLLRCVNGLEQIQSGQILLNGQQINTHTTKWVDVRQRVGMVFQSYELFPHLTVEHNLLLAPRLVRGEGRAQAAERARHLATRFGLGDRLDSYPRQLSGGQKQRIAIVRALMMDPELLLLDEITASLDPEMVREVLELVGELAREGMTMLIVTHELSFARAIADQIVFLEAGRVIERASAEAFFTDPQTPRAQEFLDTFSFAGLLNGR